MSRAYRPRLSKDKAVAQRLQDLSIASQLAAVGVLDTADPEAGSADAIEATARPSDAFVELSATPPPMTGLLKEGSCNGSSRGSSSCSRSRNSNSNRAKTPTPTGSKQGGGGSGGGGGGNDSRRRRGEWACVSCSFLNVATAKKCRMCSTENYQARLRQPTASAPARARAPAPAPATSSLPVTSAATKGVAAGVGGLRGVVARDPQRRRQSGGGGLERRSPRRAPQETSSAYSSGTAVSSQRKLEGDNQVQTGENGVERNAGAGKDGSAGDCGERAGTTQRNRRRGSAPAGAASASGAGAQGVHVPLSADEAAATAETAAVVAADNAPRRKRGRGMVEGDATTMAGAAAPGSSGGSGGDGGDGQSMGSAGDAEHLNQRTKLPSSSSSATVSSRKRGEKRPRSPTQKPSPPAAAAATAAAAGAVEGAEEVDATATHSSPIKVNHPTEPVRREHVSTLPLSGDAGPSPSPTRRCDGPTTEANDEGLRVPARTSPLRVQTMSPPCVVPPPTADCDERGDHRLEGQTLPRTTSRKGRSSPPEDVVSTRVPSAASTPPPQEGALSSPGGAGHGTPAVARVASLDFAGKPLWKVSSVVVTTATGGGFMSPGAAAAAPAPTATIVVCHSAGVSVWGLTDGEAVCMYLSPFLAGVTKEAISGSFLTAAVVGGDPGAVAPSATRAPGGDESCIVAIGRHRTDPGLPIIRVWQRQRQQQRRRRRRRQEGTSSPLLPLPSQDAENFGGRASSHGTGGIAMREKTAPAATTPSAILTVILKKKMSSFFQTTLVPRHVGPCLCVCGYDLAAAVNGVEEGNEVNAGTAVEDDGAGPAGRITAVMALGGKVLKLVFGAGGSGEPTLSAKTLPTGVPAEAVCTSLAPVPSNPFLVCASLPMANAVVLWNVRETERLFTLPLTTRSICIPATTAAVQEAMVLSPMYSNGGAEALAAAGAGAAAGGARPSASQSESSPGPPPVRSKRPRPGGVSPTATAPTAAAARRPNPKLLCLLATGNRDGCVDTTKGPTRMGCGLFGIVCTGDDDGAGTHSCGQVSAIPLEAGAGTGGQSPTTPGAVQNQRSEGDGAEGIRHGNVTGSGADDDDACLRFLSDGGNGVVVGVDGRGAIVATNVTTGAPGVLLTRDPARAAAAAGAKAGATFAAMDYDRISGVVALATAEGGVDRVAAAAAATSVDLYELRRPHR
eukprot:g8535.t2